MNRQCGVVFRRIVVWSVLSGASKAVRYCAGSIRMLWWEEQAGHGNFVGWLSERRWMEQVMHYVPVSCRAVSERAEPRRVVRHHKPAIVLLFLELRFSATPPPFMTTVWLMPLIEDTRLGRHLLVLPPPHAGLCMSYWSCFKLCEFARAFTKQPHTFSSALRILMLQHSPQTGKTINASHTGMISEKPTTVILFYRNIKFQTDF